MRDRHQVTESIIHIKGLAGEACRSWIGSGDRKQLAIQLGWLKHYITELDNVLQEGSEGR